MKTLLVALLIGFLAPPAGRVEPPLGSETSPATPVEAIEVRQSGGLTLDTIARVKTAAALNGATTTEIDRVTLRLLALTRAAFVVQAPPVSFGFPLLVSSIDAASPLVAGDIGRVLSLGSVVMGERTARLRGAQVGDFVSLEALTGEPVELSIGAIVPDDAIYWSEILVGDVTGAQLGIDRPYAVFVWGDDLARIEGALMENQVDPGVRVAGPNAEPMSDPVLPIALVKERFGEFAIRPAGGDTVEIDPAWKAANIVTVEMAPLGLFECHRLLVPYLRGVIDDLARGDLLAQIDPADFQLAGGCFNPRLNRGADPGYSLSRHTWGIAFDVNPSTNGYGAEPNLGQEVVDVFRRWGFSWGGTWLVPDGMHFEWRDLPTQYTTGCADLALAPLYAGGLWYLRPAEHPCG